jgi:hypothetical protein
MSDLQPIADRVEIEVLRGEFADATMGRDYDRLAPLPHTGQCLVDPRVNVEFVGSEEIRDGLRRLGRVSRDYLVQTAGRPGTQIVPAATHSFRTATPPSRTTRTTNGAAGMASRCLRPPATIKSAPIYRCLARI